MRKPFAAMLAVRRARPSIQFAGGNPLPMRYVVRRISLAATVLVLLFSSLPQRAGQPMQSLAQAHSSFDSDACQAAENALREYVVEHSIQYTASLLHCEVLNDWAYATAIYTDRDTRTPVSTEPFLLLVRREPTGDWQTLLPVAENAVEYDTLLDSMPAELIPIAWRDYVRMTNPQFGTTFATSSFDYSLPWASSWKGTVLQGPHDVYAIDFDLWGGDWGYSQSEDSWIVAARNGTVVYVKDVSTRSVVCDGGYEGWWYANMVVVGHGTLNPTTHRYPEYSWYVHLAPHSVPDYVRPGTHIHAGEVIGREGKTGCSWDGNTVHLHFEVSNDFPGAHFSDPIDPATGAVLQREQHPEHAPWPQTNPPISWVLPSGCTLSYGSTPCVSETDIQHDNAVILYWDADYHGPAIRYAQDNVNGRCAFESSSGKFLCNIPTFLNDRISSIQVNPEGRIFVKLHQDVNGNGYSRGWWWTEANFDNDYYDAESAFGHLMRPLNDSISSLFIDCDPCGDSSSAVSNGNSVATQNLNLDSEPPLPLCGGDPIPPTTDNATFVSDVTLPDGTVVSPDQALHKVWRVRNSGTSTWGSGYQLVFTGGDQMGAPSAVNVPGTVNPGDTVDLVVDMIAPSEPGTHRGDWRLRNAQGVFFGDNLWIQITVPDDTVPTPPPPPSGSSIELTCLDCPATVEPGQTFRPTIRAKANSGQLLKSRGDLLRNTDGNFYGAWPHIAVEYDVNTGGTYDFVFYADDPLRAPDQEGTYETRWRVWRDGHWDGDEITIRFTVQQSGGTNYPPHPPTLTGPGDWAIFQGTPVVLTAQHNGDPDGDPITGYYFDLMGPNPRNSGWIGSNTWNPQGLPYSNYEWRVKVRDSRGAESGWSPQTWHFNVLNNEPEIYEFYTVTCCDAWGGPERLCFCAKTNAGTLKVMVNTATDGSDRGEWRIINELGVPEYRCVDDSDRPPNINKLEWETGTHRARLYARREGGWENAAYRDITFSLPAERRPDDPAMLLPANDAYVNSRTVRLDWRDTLRTDDYHLEVSTDPNYGTKLVDRHLGVGTSEYTHTFDSDYETLYWRVKATGPHGTNGGEGSGSRFHIDLDPPSSAIIALPAVTTDSVFPVSWSGSDARSGLRWYDVQFRDGERGEWVTWMAQTTLTSALFRGEPGHAYYFRCRAMDQVGNWETYPSAGDGDTYTLVDPTAAPPTTWWNQDYAHKRNVIVLNNDGHTLPSGYPVHLHFDDSTTPTAEELYNASKSSTKGDDVRAVYNDEIELDRYIRRFTPSEVDIWWQTQTSVSPTASDGSYQLYYGNPSPGSPPGSIGTVMVPPSDANTLGLWHLQEEEGSTAYDSSGHNHRGALINNPTWSADGKWGSCLHFDGTDAQYVDLGNSSVWDLDNFTIEAWVYPELSSGRIVSRRKGSGSDPILFTLELKDWKPFYWSEDGGGHVWSPNTIPADTWTHLAATRDGSRSRLFVNGVEVASIPHGSWDSSANGPLVLAGRLKGRFQGFRVSNVARSSFPYGRFAQITSEPSVAAGGAIAQPSSGTPDLVLKSLDAYSSSSGEVIVQAVVRNEGDAPTTNGFYTDLYANHVPVGAGDYTGSVRFWIASPVEAGATVTLTTVLTDVVGVGGLSTAALGPLSETSTTLYAQADSTGVIKEPDDVDNISTGTEVCVASEDVYEDDDTAAMARSITLDESQQHNFDSLGDQDWVKFTAQERETYAIRTSNLGSAADTYLYLYDTDGSTLLAANDDHGGSLASQIEWTAPSNGTYYMLVKHWNPNVGGCGTRYDISVSVARTHTIYLPLMLKGYQFVPPAPTPTPTPTPTPGWHVECVDCPRFFAEMTDRTLALDTDGRPHIAYGGDHLYYAWHDGSQWHTESADNADGVGRFASLALDSANHTHIGYYDATNHDLKYAFWDGASWAVQTVDSQNEVGLGASLSLDSAGRPHLVYYDRTRQDLKYAHWDGTTWIIEVVDDTASWWWWGQASLTLDSQNHPHVSYYQGTDGSLKYATKTNGTWTLQTVDAQMGSFTTTSIAVDPSDRPHISYGVVSISPHELRHARWNGTSWEIQTVTQIGVWGGLSSLAFDSAGQPHISFQDWNGYKVRYATWNGSEWAIEDVASVGWWGGRNSLVLDADDRPHIAYHNWSPFQVRYAYKDGENWTLETVDAGGDVGAWSSVDADSSGRLHISYHDSPSMHLKYAFHDGVVWTLQTVDDAWCAGEHTSLALDSTGHPHISYRGSDHLRYARWDGTNWAIQTVDASGNAGGYTSLALDSNDRPHISHHDWDNQALKYATWDGQSWIAQAVDNIGDGGNCSHTSIAVGPDDKPNIAYYDADSQDLKVARWNGTSWAIQTVDSDGDVGCSPAIAFDSSGQPHVVYYDSSENKLKYASWDGAGWQIQTVTSQNTWAPRSALALDDNDRPHIAYTNGCVEKDARYAHWSGAEWVVETIESKGDVGSWISLALDPSGFPHVSYHDSTNGALKHAWRH